MTVHSQPRDNLNVSVAPGTDQAGFPWAPPPCFPRAEISCTTGSDSAEGRVIVSFRVNQTETWHNQTLFDVSTAGQVHAMSFSGLTGIPDAIRLANGGVGSWSISELTINGEPVCSSAAAEYGNFDIVFDRFFAHVSALHQPTRAVCPC